MTPAASSEQIRPFRRNRLLQGLTVTYLVTWFAMAVSPIDRPDWLLENVLVFVFAALLLTTYRTLPLSDTSYTLIFLFLSLHTVGAHYTYGQVPLGYWIKDEFGFGRNHFDRIAHFAYGLLFAWPMVEVFRRTLRVNRVWSYYFALEFIVAASGFFELLEAWVSQIVSPELANRYLGSQGDAFDAPNDIAAAFFGACLTLAVAAWRERESPLQRPSRTSSR